MVVISYDSGGNASIALESEWDFERDARGRIRLDVSGTCLAVVHEDGQNSLPEKDLERINRAYQFFQIVRRNAYKIVIVALNQKGQLYISGNAYATPSEAEARLRDGQGSGLIVQLNQVNQLRPLPEQTNPFSLELPVPGTIMVANGENLYGLFLKPRDLHSDLIVEWVFCYSSGGFFVKNIVERLELVDNGVQAEGQISMHGQSGEYHIFEKLRSGKTRLVFHGADPAESRAFMRARPGLFLLTKAIDTVDTH
jgi:hypothetical protein